MKITKSGIRCRQFIFVSASLLSACGGTEQAILGEKKERPRIPLIDNEGGTDPQVDPSIHLAKAFQKLIQVCEEAGGTFRERQRSCECPQTTDGTPRSFQAIYRTDPSLGLKRRVFDHYACAEHYRMLPNSTSFADFSSLLASGRDNFLKDLSDVRNIGNGRSLIFELDEKVPSDQLRDIAQYLDQNQTFIEIPNGNQWREMYRVKLFKSDESLDRVKRMPYFDFEDSGLIERYGNEIYLWNLEDFKHLNSQNSGMGELNFAPAVSPIMTDFMLGLHAFQDFLQERRDLNILEDVLIVDEGCHILCDYKASFKLEGKYYWYERNYARGEYFRHAFYMGKEDGTLDAMTLLFQDFTPSVFVTEEHQIASDNSLLIESKTLDSQGGLLRSADFSAIQTQSFSQKLRKLADFQPDRPQTTVLVLEESTQLEEPWELDYWIRGPYAAEHPAAGHSLYGWIHPEHTGTGLFSFYFGALDLNWSTDALHGREVLHDLMQDIQPGDAYGIATDFTWLLQGQRFNELVRLSKARIATISAILSVEEAECQHLTAALDADILWIAGAGNEGMENPRFRCPQKLSRKDLKIVAAAGNRESLAFFAEYGRDYADIVANPNSYLGRRGSSYSAPKVANVALKIVKVLGDSISNRELRLAILLGADVNVRQRLEVRSGGALHETYAMNAARVIAGLTTQERRQLVQKNADRETLIGRIIQASGALPAADAMDQARFLLNNGI